MDNTYLSSDEPVLLTGHKIIIGGVRQEAVLTGKRILLGEVESGKVIEDIPFTALGMITGGENGLREPTLTLTLTSPSGERRSIELIFARQIGGMNIQERDKILEFLKDHAVPVSAGLRKSEGEVTARLTAQEWMPTSYQDNAAQSVPEIPGKKRSLFISAAVILVILAVTVGVVLTFQPSGTGKTPMSSANVTLVPTVQTPADLPVPQVTTGQPQQLVTPEPAATPGLNIPSTGVWVRVTYPGNYTGSVGAKGTSIPVNSGGDNFYSLPVRDGGIEGSIEKLDSSSARLDIGIYQDGNLIQLLNTTKPQGVVDFHIFLLPSTVTAGTVITPTPLVTSAEVLLPDVPLPKTGVWVRVNYPGNFIGFIGYLGFQTPVNSTGDQFYQVPISSGDILGSIEKQDGSGDNLAVVIYKDGAQVVRLDTAVPRGIIYIHEKV